MGIPRKCLEEKAETLASQGEWVSIINIIALLVFGTVLFENVDGLVDLAVIDAFLAYHHSKESLVITVLAYAYDTFDLRCEKSSARIVCCTPALCVWLVSCISIHESRSVCPLQGHRMCLRKNKANWEELLAGMTEVSISWFPRRKEEGARVLCLSQPILRREGDAGLTGASSMGGKCAESPPTFIRGKRRKNRKGVVYEL